MIYFSDALGCDSLNPKSQLVNPTFLKKATRADPKPNYFKNRFFWFFKFTKMKLPSKSTKDYTAKKVVFKTPSASPNRLGLTIK